MRRFVTLAALALGLATACQQAAPVVRGVPADFSINTYSGWVQRWNPCVPVHYRVNLALEPGGLPAVQAAVGALSKATGITFVYDGSTSDIPESGAWNQPAPLIIAFAHPGGQTYGSSYLAGGNQLGDGGFQSQYSTINGRITTYKIIKGYAVIDANGYNRADAHVRAAVLLHELGHAVGLNHARLTSEVMYPSVSDAGPNYYSAGDLAGLAKVGRPAGCLS
ncbi:MAG TPA: matrixin family metalloprotease [Frankiaceae bacterium]|jgi:hypothetical protein|nr:matrixin family metalloprotease [Frankiaceae bacterium]